MSRVVLTRLSLILAVAGGCDALARTSVAPERSEPPAASHDTMPVVVEAEQAAPSPAKAMAFAFVVEVDQRRHVVLTATAERSWGRGSARPLVPRPDAEVAVGMPVDVGRLPESLALQLQREVDVYDVDATRCTSRLGDPLLVAQFGEGLDELGLPRRDEHTDALINYSPLRIAGAVWETQPIWLVAPLEHDCVGVWARDAELPAPNVLRRSQQPNPIADAYVAAFHASSIVPDLRAGYERDSAGDPNATPWPRLMAERAAEVSSWLDVDAQVRFLALEYGYLGSHSCEGPDYTLGYAEIVRVATATDFVPLEHTPTDPLAILDVDLDGAFEMVFADTHDWSDIWSLELRSDDPELDLAIYVGGGHAGDC
jgi:hypothetical protein